MRESSLPEVRGTLSRGRPFHKVLCGALAHATSAARKSLMRRGNAPASPALAPWRRIRQGLARPSLRAPCRWNGSPRAARGKPRGAGRNHPQDLWITLWTAFGARRQVTYRKGFFLLCLKFERLSFTLDINDLTNLSSSRAPRGGNALRGPLVKPFAVDSRIARRPGNGPLAEIPTMFFPFVLRPTSRFPTRIYLTFLTGWVQ